MLKIFIVLFSYVIIFGQERKVVLAEAEYFGSHVSSEEGFKRAEGRAVQSAIEQVAGVEIQSVSNYFKQNDNEAFRDSYSKFIQSFTNATIYSRKIIEKKLKSIQEEEKVIPVYYVKMSIELVISEEKRDESFKVKLDLNQVTFRNGEKLELGVRVSQDAYLTIINMTEGSDAYVLFPNIIMKNNKFSANKPVKIPDEDATNAGVSFELFCPDEKTKSEEILLVIATKKKVPIFAEYDKKTGFNKMTINEYQKWLSSIPMNERTMVTTIYSIYRN